MLNSLGRMAKPKTCSAWYRGKIMLRAKPKRIDVKALGWGVLANTGLFLLAFPLLILFSALTKLPAEQAVKTAEFHVLGFLFGAVITVGTGYIVAVKARHSPIFNAALYGLIVLVLTLPSYVMPRDVSVPPAQAALEIVQLALLFPLILLGAKCAVARCKLIA